MEELKKILEENLNSIIKIIGTTPIYNSNEFFKIQIDKKINDKIYFQVSKYFGEKVVHENIKNDFTFLFLELIKNYKNVNIFCNDKSFSVLINKKGNVKITKLKEKISIKENFSHNKEKNYILKENDKVDFLIHLDVMSKEGKIFAPMQKKFKQINKFLEMLKDIENSISNNSTIIDIGCGKSYLTFAIYYYFNVIKNKNVKIIGLDLKEDVVKNCNKISEELNYSNLEFFAMDIKDFEYDDKNIDLVVSLHACDTATDYSIFNAIKWNAKIIMAVPCCQHEVFGQLKNNSMPKLLGHGILKERFSSILTDSIRAEVMENFGYSTTVMEFIEMSHTPKNLMIRGIKNNKLCSKDSSTLSKQFQVYTTLEKLLEI